VTKVGDERRLVLLEIPVPPRPDTTPRLSALAVTGFALTCMAAAMVAVTIVAFFTLGSDLFWPGWVGGLWVLSFPVGLLALSVVLVARRRVRRAHGRLGGTRLVENGLGIALAGAGVNTFLFTLLAATNSG
jgi:integral membrane sensor domain MASE1